MITVEFEIEFERGSIVYIRTDTKQSPCMVTGFIFSGYENEVYYELGQGEVTLPKYFCSMELSKTKDTVLTTTN